jgi:hypothetical protein
MLMRAKRTRRVLSADVLAAALTIVTLTAASADTRAAAAPGAPMAALADDGGGRGLPPSPGPTDPNGP